MPRTRRSISSVANIVLDQVDKNKSPLKSDNMTTSPNCGDILPKENLSLKKRTVSDRSPAINKSRKKTPGQQGTPPIQNTNSTPIPSSQEKNDPFLVDKENRTPGPTPYWKVAEERGMSPRLTRSAKKQSITMPRSNSETSLDANSGVSRGLFQMEFSPPDPAEIRRMELQKEKERDERLRQERRQEGEVYFLSPSNKQQPSACTSACEKNHCESSIHSGITLNSTQFEELQMRLHEKDKENASLKAEKNMLESNLYKVQQKFDESFAKWEVEKQKLIVDNAKLQGRIQAFQTPVLTDLKDFKNLEYRVEEMSQKLGEFNTERSKNRLDSEYGARVAEMERQIAGLQQSLEKKEVELKSATKDHEEALAAAMNKLKHHESMKLTLNDCVRKLELEKNDAILRAKEVSQEVAMMKAQLVQKEEMEKELRLQLNQNTTEVSNACNLEQEDEIRELCELNESQEQEICRLRQQVERVQNMLSNERERRCVKRK